MTESTTAAVLAPARTTALEVHGLDAWYGEAQALRDVSIQIHEGEVATLVGRNGAGKTTLLRSIMGLHRKVRGTVTFRGRDVSHQGPHRRARAGLGWVPDDRGIYSSLSVLENLTMSPVVDRKAAWSLDRIFEHFPVLHTRRNFPGSKLSGGEQQMLAMARPLRMGSSLLLLDEPSEGLAPVIVQQIEGIIHEIRQSGTSVLLVEQNVHFASAVADRHYLLAQGRIVESLDAAEFRSRTGELLEHLGM
ncbi:ABC transporter ATP-binding protein [Intrasporangium calvum]|uniref:ABC transporter ATP-binding protein n=1 Tax=Intrasporangium calvum TaxID=53358 RepID=UPI000DF5DA97|nr:ABC transporter ATP-binding protein [Intrasporangium calvum]AXG12203.1 ABC transporter ATP-binding protein [Intrasporangium calvum]